MIGASNRSLSQVSGAFVASLWFGIANGAGTLRTALAANFRRGFQRLLPAVALLAALGFSGATSATAQEWQYLNWTTQVGGSFVDSTTDSAQSVALDGSGNVYVLKFTVNGAGQLGAFKIPASDPACSTPGDCFQIAANYPWAEPFGTETPQFIKADNGGNVYLNSSIELIKVPATDLTCSTPGDCIQIALGSRFNGTSFLGAMWVDGSGDVYIVEGLELNGNPNGEALVEYSPSGNTYTQSILLTWSQANGPGIPSLAVDAGGNLYLGEQLNIGGRVSNAVVKYTLSGGGYTPTTLDSLAGYFAITLDQSGNIYAAGGPTGIAKFTPSGETYTQSPIYGVGAFTLAVDGSGDVYYALGGAGDTLYETHSGPANFGSVNVGTTSAPIQLNFLLATPDFYGSPIVLTQGVTGQDFAADQGFAGFPGQSAACTASSASTNPCVAYVQFTPTKAGERQGAAVLLYSGAAVETAYFEGTGVGPQINFLPGTQSTLASGLSSPGGLAVDGSGDVFIANSGAGSVLEETFSAGSYTQSTVPTTGLEAPGGIAIDGAGNLYIADYSGNAVYEESLSGTTYTQNPNPVVTGLNAPTAVAVDAGGNLYIVNSGTAQVFMETLANGSYTQSSIGTGLVAPYGVAVDGSGNVFISDPGNQAVFKETLTAGSYTQSSIGSNLEEPEGLAVDGFGNVYISDAGLKQVLKETLTPVNYTQSVVSASGLVGPAGVAVDGNGNIYIADYLANTVYKEDLSDPPSLAFATPTLQGTTDTTDGPLTVTLQNVGNAALMFPPQPSVNNPLISANFALNSSGLNACPLVTPSSSAGTLAAGATCFMPISFEPTAAGSLPGTLVLTDTNLNAAAATQTISLGGAGVAYSPSVLTAPALGSPLNSTSVNFTWTESATQYALRIGSTGVGSSNLYNGADTTALSATVSGLPTNGETVYVRLFSMYSGAWHWNDYTFTAFTGSPATILSPTAGTQFSNTREVFTWSAGVGATEYALRIGSTGVGSSDLFNGPYTTTMTAIVTGLPANGEKVYARLWSYVGGAWQWIDYTYTACTGSPATMSSPSGGATLGGVSQLFTWSAGIGVTQYALHIGSTGKGSDNIYDGADSATALSATVSSLPTNGETLYVRLWSMINGTWQWIDYTYTAFTGSAATISSPTAGTTFAGATQLFSWSAGVNATEYALRVGTTGVGSSNIYDGGDTTARSVTVTTLPLNGATVNVRLWSLVGGAWQWIDYTYTAYTGTAATMQSPTGGTQFSSTSQLFTWHPGVGVSEYALRIGTTGVGSSNLYNGADTTALSATVNSLPNSAVTVYVRLWSLVGNTWQWIDYTYTGE